MKLSPSDIELVASLRLKQLAWKNRRWYCLGAGIFCILVGVWFVFDVAQKAAGTDRWNGEIVCVTPVPWIFFIQGIVMCVATLSHWRGSPTAHLLLKLLDDRDRPERGQAPSDAELAK